jgi:hypothetical protein
MKTQQKLNEKLKRAYGEHAVSWAQVSRWHKAFLDDHMRVWKTNFILEDLARQKRTKM